MTMAVVRIRLCEADRRRWGGDEELPEELLLDTEALRDVEAGELIEWERETDLPLAMFVPSFEAGSLAPAQFRLVAIWLALRMAGHAVAWAGFAPRVFRAEFTHEVSAGPPAGPSELSSEGEAQPSSSPA
jgi:hypothetical protein